MRVHRRCTMAAVLAGLLYAPGKAVAQPDYTKKERVQCTVCHEGSWTSGKYTEAGRYYMQHHTFKGYRRAKAADRKGSKGNVTP